MAKQAKPEDKAPKNGIDEVELARAIKGLDAIDADLLSEQGSYMNTCRNIRQGAHIIYERADSYGIPKKILKDIMSARKLDKRRRAIRDGLDMVAKATYDEIAEKIGAFKTTPLGEAALRGAPGAPKEKDPVEAAKTDAAATLAAGLKALPGGRKGPNKIGTIYGDGRPPEPPQAA